MPRGGHREGAGKPVEIKQPMQGRTRAYCPYPTSPYRTFESLGQAEEVAASAKGQAVKAKIADGFVKRPRKQCLWLYARPNSRPDGRTITVYGETAAAGLVYFRENGEFQ